jgi:pimeloyl-ACP methyl ester carboxylesterase
MLLKLRIRNLKQLAYLALLSVLAGTACSTSNDASHSEYLALGEDSVHFEVAGQGFPLILVSGGSGMDSRQWGLIAPVLAQTFRVIQYEPRGVGRSDNPTVKYSDSADLAGLLDHLQLDRVGLIGVSSAGGFILEFAIQHPDRVAGVVAAAPFVPGFEFSDTMMARLNLINQAAQQGKEPFLDQMFEDPHFIPAPLDPSVRNSAREFMADQFDKAAGFDPGFPLPLLPPLIEQLANISSPVLLLAGELDHPEVLRRNKYLLAQIPLAEEKIIDQAGHNGPLENPGAFLSAMNSFLRVIARQ